MFSKIFFLVNWNYFHESKQIFVFLLFSPVTMINKFIIIIFVSFTSSGRYSWIIHMFQFSILFRLLHFCFVVFYMSTSCRLTLTFQTYCLFRSFAIVLISIIFFGNSHLFFDKEPMSWMISTCPGPEMALLLV